MHCPQCGQQQVSETVRFCSRCGLPLDGVILLLSNNGMLPVYAGTEEANEISPRKRGVRQGGILMLTGVLLVPILGVLSHFADSNFLQLLVAIAALICFVGGPLRMIYAAIFEDGGQNWRRVQAPYAQPSMLLHQGLPQRSALPPPPAHQPTGWNPRPHTGEIVRPPSVTEGTTRLLDKDDPTNR
ncbi:MAG TPA: zinc ribbon domain-containing protein [Pyrinomonadaceae bacterium]